jgi:hypothetical protein
MSWSERMLRKARQNCFDRDCEKVIAWLKARLNHDDFGGKNNSIICLSD